MATVVADPDSGSAATLAGYPHAPQDRRDCWTQDPTNRPFADKIVERLQLLQLVRSMKLSCAAAASLSCQLGSLTGLVYVHERMLVRVLTTS